MSKYNLDYLSHIYGSGKNLLRVVTYHRVGEPAEKPFLNPQQISATTRGFEAQMKFLANHYAVVSMEQVLNAVYNGARLPKRAVLITFDDACCDVKENAWPILKRYKLPATVFVPTAYPNQPGRTFWWDKLYRSLVMADSHSIASPVGTISLTSDEERWQGVRTLQNYVKTLSHDAAMTFVEEVSHKLNGKQKQYKTVLDWDELRQLAKEGLNFGGHTQTHPILTQLSLAEVRQEVRGSLADLKRELGDVLPSFAYPNGNHNDNIINILREEGYQVAFSTRDGFCNLDKANPFSIRRTNITRKTTLKIFRLRLKKWFSYLDVLRHN